MWTSFRGARLSSAFLIVASLLFVADAAGQISTSRILLVPLLGAGTRFTELTGDGGIRADAPALGAWSYGAQVELASGSRWIPLVGAQRWHIDRTCPRSIVCSDRGWSAETGLLYSFLPSGVYRPYGGAVAGLQHFDESHAYVEGRAGMDFVSSRWPVGLRVEGRFHDPLDSGLPRLAVLSTGVRITLSTL